MDIVRDTRTCWHASLYVTTRIVWNRFMCRRDWWRDTETTNRCLYIRTLLVYLPLLVLIYVGLALTVFGIAVVAIPYWIGITAALAGVGTMIGTFLTGTLVVFLFWALWKAAMATADLVESGRRKIMNSDQNTLRKEILEWFRDRHGMVCRSMKITGGKS